MFKKLTKKEDGFTLAELLIVVAIIAVLVAVSIPIFTSQLEKSREATDLANLRAAYAEATVALMDEEVNGTKLTDGAVYWYNPNSGKLESSGTACGKGTNTKVTGTKYAGETDADANFSKYAYDGLATTTKGIKCTFSLPATGGETSVAIAFAEPAGA